MTLEDFIAANVMSRDVMLIPQDMEMHEAARLLRQAQVSGAPVVDSQGRCVGVLSTADLVRQLQEGEKATNTPELPITCGFWKKQMDLDGKPVYRCSMAPGACPFQREDRNSEGGKGTVCSQPHCVPTDWQVVQVEKPDVARVQQYMTADPVTVTPETLIDALAQRMIDAQVHRLIVVDEECRPIGIVSSTDIMAVVAYHLQPPAF
jgi:predicted transcriptional regulator